MYITTQNSQFQKYKALVTNFTALPDWKFKVEYYDDEGNLCIEVVDHSRLEGEFIKEQL